MNLKKQGIYRQYSRPLSMRLFLLTLLLLLAACGPTTTSTPVVTQVSPTPAISPSVPPPSPTPERRWSEQTRLSRGVILSPPRFSPDGSRFAVPTSNGTTVYDTQDWSEILELGNAEMDRRPPSALAFSPDGNLLAIAHGGKIRFWQETGGEPPGPVDLGSDSSYITALEFSPDGNVWPPAIWKVLNLTLSFCGQAIGSRSTPWKGWSLVFRQMVRHSRP
jgi:WD40 repeat protein